MFRIDFFVDDRKLPAALLALVGIAHGAPNVVPVVNVRKKGNGLAAKTEGSSMDRFAAELKSLKGKSLAAADVQQMMKPLGLSHKSYSYMLKNAITAKLLKKTGKGAGTATRYVVL